LRRVPAEALDVDRARQGVVRTDGPAEPPASHPLLLTAEEFGVLHALVLEMEAEGKVTRTFRRLEPERQAAIVDEVLKEAIRFGRHGVTVRTVAAKLGLSAATLYTYFEDRDAMLEFATRLAVRISLMGAAEEFDPTASADLAQALRDHLWTDLDYVATHWSIAKYCWQSGYRGETDAGGSVLEPVARVMRSRIRHLLAKASERGELREGLDVDEVCRVVNAMMLVVADARFVDHLNQYLLLYPDDGTGPEDTIAVVIDIITQGLCNRSQGVAPSDTA
jgi:AcrR family transcriptional regulator